MLHGQCHDRDLNSILSTSNHSDFGGCLRGYTAYVSNLPLYYIGIITFLKKYAVNSAEHYSLSLNITIFDPKKLL